MAMIRFAGTTIGGYGAGSSGVADLLLEPNIVISKFSHLSVVDAENLCFFSGTKAKAGNEVHNPEDDSLLKGTN